jgi:MFS family permease
MNESLMRKSIFLGVLIGAIFGGLIGAGFGAITMTLNGALIGMVVGLVLGVVTGALTAALTVKTAGTTGGIGVGYFTGMFFGAVFGMMLGALIPAPLWTSLLADGLPMLDELMTSRFETVIHFSFLLSVLAAIVGVWVGGKNLVPSPLEVIKYYNIDQYDLVEITQVPEEYKDIIDIGDIGVVVEIDDNESFEIECLRPDGSYKWLETLHSKYLRLKSKIPDNM